MSVRPERVAQRMRREVAEILERRLRDPGISGLVSVTDVEVSSDLSAARVYVSVMGSAEQKDATLQALGRAAGFVRHELSPRLGLRETPEVTFHLDTSIERGARVEELLRRLRDGEAIPDPDEGT